MKKLIAIALVLALTLSLAAASALTIAIPNDATNEGRALLLLQAHGIITLDEDAGLTATKLDVIDNPLGIVFMEVDAANVYNMLKDVDYAIINNNYALEHNLNPVTQSLMIEDANSPYVNVVCVKEGNEENELTKALVAATTSQAVVDYITNVYGGAAVATVVNPTDGYDETVDYAALEGTVLTIAATATPHADVLENVVKDILAAKGITLDVRTVIDYKTPNLMVDGGDVYANFFAHEPYQNEFNAAEKTHIVVVAGIHVEPMALYGGQQTTLDALTVK